VAKQVIDGASAAQAHRYSWASPRRNRARISSSDID